MRLSYVLFLVLLSSCKGQDDPSKSSAFFKPSYKEILTKAQDSSKFIEYYDSTTNLYSNFRYGFSMKFPINWSIDKGASEHTVIRGYESDSAATFSISVIELENDKNSPFSLWKYYDENKNSLEPQYISAIEKSLNSKISDYSIKKVYIDNREALQRDCIYNIKNQDGEYQMKSKMYQVANPPFIFTIGFHVPLVFFKENQLRFYSLVNGFCFIPQQHK